MKIFRIITILLLATSSISFAESIDKEKYVADSALRLFSVGCLGKYPNPELFATWVLKNKFDEVPNNQVKNLIREKGGKAYSVNNNGVRYLLVAEANNMCTVFVKEVEFSKASTAIDELRNGLKSPELVEKINVKDSKLSVNPIITTHYDYYGKDSGNWLMRIVVSQSKSKIGFYQLAITGVTSQRERANKRK